MTWTIWFGFDKPGNSLGINLTGSTLAGPVWADFMREVHQGLPFKDFVKPSTGIVEATVCAKSGLLKTANCPSEATLPFLEGTQPIRYCEQHDGGGIRALVSIEGMRQDTLFMDSDALLGELKLPELHMPEWQTDQDSQTRQRATTARASASRSTRTGAATRTPQTSGRTGSVPRQSGAANQPAPDFRGSDYEGALPPVAPAEDIMDPTLSVVNQSPETGPAPAAASRNTRNNPIFSDEEFVLELPDYNPLLE